jgi:hypothetical protein
MVQADENNHYTDEIEIILENIRVNSVILHDEHRTRYLQLKSTLKYFKIPVIIISSISSIVSLSQQYLEQNVITILNMTLGLACSIIGSLELFFAISSQLIKEADISKEYQILAYDIYKCLQLKRKDRPQNGTTFLEHSYGVYCKLVENSSILRHVVEDKLCKIPDAATLDNAHGIRPGPSTPRDALSLPLTFLSMPTRTERRNSVPEEARIPVERMPEDRRSVGRRSDAGTDGRVGEANESRRSPYASDTSEEHMV